MPHNHKRAPKTASSTSFSALSSAMTTTSTFSSTMSVFNDVAQIIDNLCERVSILERARVMTSPPGLSDEEVSVGSKTCLPDSMPEYDVVDLARRIQRIEILLFHLSEPNFKKLDEHINSIVATSLSDDKAEFPLRQHCSEKCEAFQLDHADVASDLDTTRDMSDVMINSMLEQRLEELEGANFVTQSSLQQLMDPIRQDIAQDVCNAVRQVMFDPLKVKVEHQAVQLEKYAGNVDKITDIVSKNLSNVTQSLGSVARKIKKRFVIDLG